MPPTKISFWGRLGISAILFVIGAVGSGLVTLLLAGLYPSVNPWLSDLLAYNGLSQPAAVLSIAWAALPCLASLILCSLAGWLLHILILRRQARKAAAGDAL